eukprot:g907.t1
MRRIASAGAAGLAVGTLVSTTTRGDDDVDDGVVVVIGGGVMGLAAAWKLAVLARESGRASRIVLFDEGHPVRGSWGKTRASHLSMEDEVLLQMNIIAMNEWDSLEKIDEKDRIRTPIGRIIAGPLGSVDSIARALTKVCPNDERCRHAIMSFEEVNKRWPKQIRLFKDEEALYLPNGGFSMAVERALSALRDAAEKAGVEVFEDEAVVRIDRTRKTLTTDQNNKIIKYDRLVICAGPWTNKVLSLASPPLSLMPIVVSEEQTLDIASKSDVENPYSFDRMPLFSWSSHGYKGASKSGSCRYFYTVPSTFEPGGLKIGYHRQGALLENSDEFIVTTAGRAAIETFPHIRKDTRAEMSGAMDEFNREAAAQFARRTLPGLDPGRVLCLMRCLYQMSPDRQMILGKTEESEDIFVACGFSGGGFQHAPVIGSFIAETVLEQAVEGERSVATTNRLLPEALKTAMARKFSPKRFIAPRTEATAETQISAPTDPSVAGK